MKKMIVVSVLVIIALFGVVFTSGSATNLDGVDVEIYKSASCGCCGFYADYLKSKGANVKVNTVSESELAQVKGSAGIPASMQSCHTTKIGDYFVEGHVPVEAITKLIEEKPSISGIAIPGMPSGSPGMPGPKSGAFTVYSITNGAVSEFTKI